MKRFISVVLAFVLVLTFAVLAEELTPSKILDDEIEVVSVESMEPDVVIADDFYIGPADEEADKELSKGVLTDICEILNNNGNVTDYFDDETKAAIEALLPEGVALEDLDLKEAGAIISVNYRSEYGDILATFKYVTEYSPEQTLVGVVGIFETAESPVEWNVIEATAQEDGTVVAIFPGELVEKIEAAYETVFMVLDK